MAREQADRTEIVELKYAYAGCVDYGRRDALIELFTDDAKLDYLGDQEFEGREGIETFADEATGGDREMMHLMVNPVLDIEGDAASGHWYYVVFVVEGGRVEMGVGEYEEAYRRVEGEWKIAGFDVWRNFTLDLGEVV